MTVRFNYADAQLSYSPKTRLKDMVKTIFLNEKVAASTINYIFCSDEYLLNINRSALNHDYYTDIITFPLHDKGMPVEAEIYISIDRVKENAISHKNDFKDEISRVVAHGALHLCGYKDKSKKDVSVMRDRESYYIKTLTRTL